MSFGVKSKKQTQFIYLLKIYIKYAKWWFVVVCFSTLISPLLAYVDIVILRESVDFLSTTNELSVILKKCFLWISIYIITIIINCLIEMFWGENMNMIISNRINRNIYTQILKTDYKYFDLTKFYNDYIWTINNFYNQTFSAAQIVWQFLMAIFTISTIGALMVSMDFVVLLIVLFSVIITSFFKIISDKEIFKKNEESIIHQRMIGYIQRVFYIKDYAMSIKTTHIKDTLLQKYDESTLALSSIIKRHRKKVTVLSITSSVTIYFTKVITLLYLVIRVYCEQITLGELTALFYASITLKNQLDWFATLITRAKNLNLYTEGIKRFFEFSSKIENDINVDKIPEEAISVQFNSVQFKYCEEGKLVLKDINFSINAGEKVAIVGRNGVGKSTIVKLLLRLYDVSSGEILINGKNICNINVNNLRDVIGVAFQDNVMYAFSVKENIDIYGKSIEDDRLNELLEHVGIDRILEKNEATCQTGITRELNENGIELSGGEQQLIAIARVLTKEFGLLIFDEPSASLDPVIESKLIKLIMSKSIPATTILISHRLSSVKSADKILFIENGTIAECGTHQELIQQGGKYCELYRLQAEGYIE